MKKILLIFAFIFAMKASSQNCPLTYSVYVTPATCSVCCDGMAYVQVYYGGCPAYTYSWSTGSTNDTIFNICGYFSFQLTISDQGCCQSSIFSGYCGVVTGSTGITEMSDEAVSISPNPFSKELSVYLKKDEVYTELIFYSVLGEEVKRIPASGSTVKVDLEGFPPDLYYLKIVTSDKTYLRKVLKQ